MSERYPTSSNVSLCAISDVGSSAGGWGAGGGPRSRSGQMSQRLHLWTGPEGAETGHVRKRRHDGLSIPELYRY